MVTVVPTRTVVPEAGDAPQSSVGLGSVSSVAATLYVRIAPPGPSAIPSLVIVIVTTGGVVSGRGRAVNVSVSLPSLPDSSVAVQLMVTVAPTATWAPEAGDVPQSIVGVGSRASIAETV